MCNKLYHESELRICHDNDGNPCIGCLGREGICNRKSCEGCKKTFQGGSRWCGFNETINGSQCIDKRGTQCVGCLGREGVCNGKSYQSCSDAFSCGAQWCEGGYRRNMSIIISCPVVACIVILAIIVLVFHKKRRKTKNIRYRINDTTSLGHDGVTPNIQYLHLESNIIGNLQSVNVNVDLKNHIGSIPYDSRREIPRTAFQIDTEIGRGNFGKVHKGVLNGLYGCDSETTIAIKSINARGSENDLMLM